MAWADTINMLLNMGKGFRERGQQSQALASQGIQNIYNRKAESSANADKMLFAGLSGLGEGISEGITDLGDKRYDWNKMEAEQAFEKPYKDTTAEMQRAQQVLDEETLAAEKARYIYPQHFVVLSVDENGKELGVQFKESKNPADHEENIEKLRFYADLLKSQGDIAARKWLIDYEHKMYPSNNEKDVEFDISKRINDDVSVLDAGGAEFFNTDGTPRLDKYNNDYDAWATALYTNEGVKNQLRQQIRNIINDYPKAVELGYLDKVEDYLNGIIREYTSQATTEEEKPDTTGGLGKIGNQVKSQYSSSVLQQLGSQLVEPLTKFVGNVGGLPKLLLEKLGLSNKYEKTKSYLEKMPATVNTKSVEEQAMYTMAKLAMDGLNRKAATIKSYGMQEDEQMKSDRQWLTNILSWIDSYKVPDYAMGELKTKANQTIGLLQDYVNRYSGNI